MPVISNTVVMVNHNGPVVSYFLLIRCSASMPVISGTVVMVNHNGPVVTYFLLIRCSASMPVISDTVVNMWDRVAAALSRQYLQK